MYIQGVEGRMSGVWAVQYCRVLCPTQYRLQDQLSRLASHREVEVIIRPHPPGHSPPIPVTQQLPHPPGHSPPNPSHPAAATPTRPQSTNPSHPAGSDHKATPTRSQSTNHSLPTAAGSDGNYGGDNTSSRRHGAVRNAIYIPPWPTRVYGRLCSNEASGRQEGNTPSIDTRSCATLPGCTSVTEGQGNGGVDEIKGCRNNAVDEPDVHDNTSSYGYHVSENGHSVIGSSIAAADNSDVASTSRVYSAINAVALAQLDMKQLPMQEIVTAWLAGVDPNASPVEEQDCDRRRRKRRAECEGADGATGKRRKC